MDKKKPLTFGIEPWFYESYRQQTENPTGEKVTLCLNKRADQIQVGDMLYSKKNPAGYRVTSAHHNDQITTLEVEEDKPTTYFHENDAELTILFPQA